MADSGKGKTPTSETKNSSGGKKKRKHHRKSSGDGAPSPAPAKSSAAVNSPEKRAVETPTAGEHKGENVSTASLEKINKITPAQAVDPVSPIDKTNNSKFVEAAVKVQVLASPDDIAPTSKTQQLKSPASQQPSHSQQHPEKKDLPAKAGPPSLPGKAEKTKPSSPRQADKVKPSSVGPADTPKDENGGANSRSQLIAGDPEKQPGQKVSVDSKDNSEKQSIKKVTGDSKGGPEKQLNQNPTADSKGGSEKRLNQKVTADIKGGCEKQQIQTVTADIKVQPAAANVNQVKVKSKPEQAGKGEQRAEQARKADTADGEGKSKAQLRAERRAKQEAQRAAKESKKGDASSSVPPANSAIIATAKKETGSEKSKPLTEVTVVEKVTKKKPAIHTVISSVTEEELWARKEREMLGETLKIDNSILNLGFQYFHHKIVGANARCVALLATLKEVISKYKTPSEKELSRDLEKNLLNPCIKYINYCRPISTSMGNAIKHLKYNISQISRDTEDEAAISSLNEVIDKFIQENIIKAAEAIAAFALSKIDDGDVILVYAASSLIGQVLKTAYQEGKKFRVIVVEGRPRSEGKSMLRYLVRCGIPCSYIYIGSASHAMSEATKVFLGAAAMFAIGDMYSRSGNSMIAALAKANNLPVLVCCETYKFTDKVQLHTGDSNLHTRDRDLVTIGHKRSVLTNWEELGLGLLNLMYDVTSSQHITGLVTELGMLPCTSVPVVLRRQEDVY